MSEPFIGEIRMFAGTFNPRSWALCDGQLLPISQNTALFSIVGTLYGGDGRTTFALPDLRGRVPIHAGQGPGLPNYNEGARGGVQTTLHSVSSFISSDADLHAHELVAGTAGTGVPSTTVATVPTVNAVSSSAPNTDNRQPYLAINFIIALQGIFPTRN